MLRRKDERKERDGIPQGSSLCITLDRRKGGGGGETINITGRSAFSEDTTAVWVRAGREMKPCNSSRTIFFKVSTRCDVGSTNFFLQKITSEKSHKVHKSL